MSRTAPMPVTPGLCQKHMLLILCARIGFTPPSDVKRRPFA